VNRSLIHAPVFHIMLAAAAVMSPAIGWGAEQPQPVSSGDLKQLQGELETQKRLLDEQAKALREQANQLQGQQSILQEQRQQLDSLRSLFYGDGVRPTAAPSGRSPKVPVVYSIGGNVGATDNGGVSKAQQQTQQPAQGGTAAPVQKPASEGRPDIPGEALASQGGVLTPPGTVILEPSFDYSYNTDNRVLLEGVTIVPGITIGTTDIRKVNESLQTYAMTLRGGITKRLEADVRVPYVRSNQSTTARAVGAITDTVTDSNGSGLGDVEVGAHYQVNDGTEGWPFFIANVRYKTTTGKSPFEVPVDPNTGVELSQPTGSGFQSWEPSVTLIYPSDPVVFFSNLRFIHNVGKTVTLQPSPGTGGVPFTTNLHPGDGFGGSVGMGFGINERASFSLGYEHTHIMQTTQGGQPIAGSSFDLASYNFGFAYKISQWVSANLAFSVGATSAAPDTRIIVRVPVRLQVF
jgi:hypothetical protein